jgi:rhodanese-related sulfurtransferase
MKLTKPARIALWTGLGLSVALVSLWWIADHRRGMDWAMRIVRDRFPDVRQLPPAELARWLADAKRPSPLLLDARSADEFATSHLADAVRIDPATSDHELKAILPSGRPLVFYCAAGYRGSQMARRAQALGHNDVSNLEGGIFHWANEGHQVVRDDTPTTGVHPFASVFSRLLHPSRRVR